jgi:hypothetical protein
MEVYLTEEDLFLPKISGVSSKKEFEFFAHTINGAFGESLVWVGDRYEWISSEEGTFGLNGLNASAAVIGGSHGEVFTKGLEKTILVNSNSLELTAESGDTSVIIDSETTTSIKVFNQKAEIHLIDLSSHSFEESNFSLQNSLLTYQSEDLLIELTMEEASSISLRSAGSASKLTVTYSNDVYAINSNEVAVELLTDASLAEHDDLRQNEIEINNQISKLKTANVITENQHEQSNFDFGSTPAVNLEVSQDIQTPTLNETGQFGLDFQEDGFDISNIIDSYYTEKADLPDLNFIDDVGMSVLQATRDSIDEIISDSKETLDFEMADEAILVPEIANSEIKYENQNLIQDSLLNESVLDYVFDSAIDFYDEI